MLYGSAVQSADESWSEKQRPKNYLYSVSSEVTKGRKPQYLMPTFRNIFMKLVTTQVAIKVNWRQVEILRYVDHCYCVRETGGSRADRKWNGKITQYSLCDADQQGDWGDGVLFWGHTWDSLGQDKKKSITIGSEWIYLLRNENTEVGKR